ncbi:hypothetical protein N7456_006785 [Penicillium angulare]|uniref:Uncharacterized protein n=1 Tax=Penicillium angulare TaxID=116970 RepID=A0A9W9FI93_9EURO|nr:hypothetical protein N7456_006785 [Penicillium angulare]
MAEAAECSEHRRNLSAGTCDCSDTSIQIASPMLEAFCDSFLETIFLWNEFQTLSTTSSFSRALASQCWPSQSLTINKMTEETECSQSTMMNICKNLRQFGSVHAPSISNGME